MLPIKLFRQNIEEKENRNSLRDRQFFLSIQLSSNLPIRHLRIEALSRKIVKEKKVKPKKRTKFFSHLNYPYPIDKNEMKVNKERGGGEIQQFNNHGNFFLLLWERAHAHTSRDFVNSIKF